MSEPEVVRHRDGGELATAVAGELARKIQSAVAERGVAHVALTGGGIGIRTLVELRNAAERIGLDWSAVHLWWGDERFLPDKDRERNETQACEALIDHIDIPSHQVHPIPASDGADGDSVEHAATRYSRELAVAAHGAGPVPSFDVCLLGVGPDAHVASLFPGLPQVHDDEAAVVGVHEAPKPPPRRVTLTLPSIRSSRRVWLIASGEGKAEAVRLGLAGGPVQEAPVAGARGRESTVFWLDEEAASRI
ncbi:6-phosphogluconolactonase [Nocardiopsis xinjiangensis]|uniref:6-phosphogluconolactonase n=1 Tax=Nocardiopsis xinjiangensis TaxID=124285 RepID=UPI000349EF38|nr:6-phosphogluconolactonase [Nocardiopsis xinjiangensis]